ncbi:HPr family phosphocarrier protein [Brevibacillus choshinensis]|uniref:HPr family phosphocarrier protein n=1 Tax=Brevibacillus choshinensis TaxID=54911 RepID=UPI002E242CAB|nr:HPr family phosphocarrier protein [Brevibacillus choshinensis]
MVAKTFVIQNPTGLHARPASMFVQKAAQFPCEVHVLKGSRKVNGKSIMGLMALGAAKNDEITLEVNGEREQEALEELGKVLTHVHG